MSIFAAQSSHRQLLFRSMSIGLLVITAVVFFSLVWETITPSTARNSLDLTHEQERYLYYYSPINVKKVALTFDDGPDQDTYANMTILQKYGVPATFFFIGSKALRNPDIVYNTVSNGFDIGNHSFTHSFNVQNSERRLMLELRSTNVILQRAAHVEPTYYRPPFLLAIGVDPGLNPYIETSKETLWSLALGYHPVGIDIDSKDWLASTAEEVVTEFKTSLATHNGHIALFHDVPHTAEALEEIIPWLLAEGYDIVSLDELLEPPTSFNLTQTLTPGDTDSATKREVSLLQWFLYKKDLLDPYAISGIFDQPTEEALILFQTQENIAERGIVGTTTRNYIAATSGLTSGTHTTPDSTIRTIQITAEGGMLYVLSLIDDLLFLLAGLTLSFIMMRTCVMVGLLVARRFMHSPTTPPQDYTPVVSVLIPAYNEAENIRSTLLSVIRNTYLNREIIVINDGSTDETATIVESTQRAYPHEKLTLVNLENGGKARALTHGLQTAKGSILVVVDADAALDRYAIERLVPYFIEKNVGAVAGKVETAKERSFLGYFQALEYAVGQNIDKRAFSVLGAVGVVPGPVGAWRTSMLRQLGGFPADTLVEDQDLTLMALRAGYRTLYEPHAIAYTETPQTVSNFLKQRSRWVYGTIQCFWKHKGVVLEKPLSPISFLIMPNLFIFGIAMPLTYPLVDIVLVGSLFFGLPAELLTPIIVFTIVDMLYALWGLMGEQHAKKLVWFVPLQRIFYRQLLYYTVIQSLVRAIEGRGARWNKFAKVGTVDNYYHSTLSPTSSN